MNAKEAREISDTANKVNSEIISAIKRAANNGEYEVNLHDLIDVSIESKDEKWLILNGYKLYEKKAQRYDFIDTCLFASWKAEDILNK